MIKRPLNPQFSEAVLMGWKTSTIRGKAWPIGKPIMLYNWSGLPYRSKQIDVAEVIVSTARPIEIHRRPDSEMFYACTLDGLRMLYQTEGFATQAQMDDWFRAGMLPGQTLTKFIMRFRVANAPAQRPPATDV